MTKVSFELPSSSLPELEKIIAGYYVLGTNVSLDDISDLTRIHRTTLSPNHGFLKAMGIIQGTNKKSATPLGKDLGGAIHHHLPDEVQRYWLQAVDSSEFLSKVAVTVNLKKNMSRSEITSHILFVAKAKDTKTNRTGANAIIDILLKSKRLEDIDGKLMWATPEIQTENIYNLIEEDEKPNSKIIEGVNDPINTRQFKEQEGLPSLNINIQIHISADASPDQIDKIFASMAKHLRGFGKSTND